jgi:carbon storage regulator
MLVLSRKPGEQIMLGDSVAVTVVAVRGNRVRLAIEAPQEVPIRRTECPPRNQTRREEPGKSPFYPECA